MLRETSELTVEKIPADSPISAKLDKETAQPRYYTHHAGRNLYEV
jgi:hypothetical protein